ncbi:MAG: glycosyltransferase family 9 protein, partial [Pseudomonadota bacterium]
INQENVAVTVNLSFSKSSSYLTSLIHSKHHLGLCRKASGELAIDDKWSQYVYATVMAGGLNPFSLVDIFSRILGAPSCSLEELSSTNRRPIQHIILHPFASHAKKKWKSNKWAEIIYRILKKNPQVKISIVGSKEEIPESQSLLQMPLVNTVSAQIQDLTGKTNIQELFNHILQADLFIGHDSMVGHLSSLAGLQCLTISLGTVRPAETTPYGLNNFNLHPKTKCFPCFPSDPCDFYKCHADIPYQVVCAAVQQLVDKGDISADELKKENSVFHLDSVHLCRTQMTNRGMLQIVDILGNNPTLADIYRLYYRMAWLYVFEEKEEQHSFPILNTNIHKLLLADLKGLQHLFELLEFGKRYCRYILEEIASKVPNISKIKEYGKKIDEIEQLQGILKRSFPMLAPLIDHSFVAKANLRGISIVELTESSYFSYEQTTSITRIVYELIQNSIAEYKITNNKDKVASPAPK